LLTARGQNTVPAFFSSFFLFSSLIFFFSFSFKEFKMSKPQFKDSLTLDLFTFLSKTAEEQKICPFHTTEGTQALAKTLADHLLTYYEIY
jgi:hypothetical protein